jgi:multidrug efflux pump subunit AcrB
VTPPATISPRACGPLLAPIAARHGVNIKISEVPPGPPVLSTMVAEVYGPELEGRLQVAAQVKQIFSSTEGVVDTDWMVEEPVPHTELVVDHEKAIRHGISAEVVARTLRLATAGASAGLLHVDEAREDIPLVLRLERGQRSTVDDLLALRVHGADGRMVPLGELVRRVERPAEQFIYHKNLQPVSYVVGELAGTEESPVYAILQMKERVADIHPGRRPLEVMSTHLPQDRQAYSLKWDGEWHITYEVFRDMGLAFAVVMVLIYLLVVGWFKSFVTPIIIMTPIP